MTPDFFMKSFLFGRKIGKIGLRQIKINLLIFKLENLGRLIIMGLFKTLLFAAPAAVLGAVAAPVVAGAAAAGAIGSAVAGTAGAVAAGVVGAAAGAKVSGEMIDAAKKIDDATGKIHKG